MEITHHPCDFVFNLDLVNLVVGVRRVEMRFVFAQRFDDLVMVAIPLSLLFKRLPGRIMFRSFLRIGLFLLLQLLVQLPVARCMFLT